MDCNSDEASQHCVPTHTGGPSGPSQQDVLIQTGSAPPNPSRFSNSASKRASAPQSQKRSPAVTKPTSAPPHQSTDTFWTMCQRCSKRFEYLIIYHNCTIGCFSCYAPFLASKAAPPANCGESGRPSEWRSAVNNIAGRRAYHSRRNFAAAKKSGSGQVGRQSAFSCEESNAGGGWGCSKKRTRNSRKKTSVGSGSGSGSGSGIRTHRPQSARELTPLETREMLMHKARKVIAQRLSQSTMPHQEP